MVFVKQIVAFFIAFVFVAFSGGISVSQHFCGSHIKSTSLNAVNHGCQAQAIDNCQTGITTPNCCSDQQSFFQTSHFSFHKKILLSKYKLAVAEITHKPISTFQPIIIGINHNLPPPKIPLYKKVQCFLI